MYKKITATILIILFCSACHDQDVPVDGELVVVLPFLKKEFDCSQPNAVDIGATFIPAERRCINGKLYQGLIYNNSTGLPVLTTSVSNGTQLECRGLGGAFVDGNVWYKSEVDPIPTGYQALFIAGQVENKDGAGNVISYQPFTSYASGDILICVPRPLTSSFPVNYQIVKIL